MRNTFVSHRTQLYSKFPESILNFKIELELFYNSTGCVRRDGKRDACKKTPSHPVG
jgi:hypothetical protein